MKSCDIFCRVIDNYGDIGVCWRLARQLAHDFPLNVRLWVDDIDALIHIWPDVTTADSQYIDKVDVRVWPTTFPEMITPAEIVIEAFACHLPDIYVAAMVGQKQSGNAPHWFNLEYLSAESWVDDCHGLISMHPQNGLKKVFFFPGFTTKTGGLLREKNLLLERNRFIHAPDLAHCWLDQFALKHSPDSLLISLFAYENPSLNLLLEAWVISSVPIVCIVPQGRVLTSINTHFGLALSAGQEFRQGNLWLKIIPFLSQLDYDRLLWSCDINFVRGEDSFVRAQWAGKPLIWHIYPQEDNIHLVKLTAFLALYTKAMDSTLAEPLVQLWLTWNQGGDCSTAWNKVIEQRQSWLGHSEKWQEHLNSLGDLASNMVQFSQKTL